MSEKKQKLEAIKVPEKVTKEYDPATAPFSWDKLDGLLAYKSSLVVCSDILEISDTTIKKHIKKRFDMTFTQYAERKLSRTKVKLVQKALEMAYSGNVVMTIFCLKNINKWQDRFETEIDFSKSKIELAYKVE